MQYIKSQVEVEISANNREIEIMEREIIRLNAKIDEHKDRASMLKNLLHAINNEIKESECALQDAPVEPETQ